MDGESNIFKAMDKKSAIKITTRYLDILKRKRYKILNAYLFGSYATGKQHEWSDIDIAIIFKSIKNNFLLDVKLSHIGIQIDSRIEPHSIEVDDFTEWHPLANEIMKTGIKIK